MQARGPEQILQYFQGVKSAFPDMAGQVVSAIAMGNTAAIELRSEGTHTEPMRTSRGTLPPTGKRVVIKLAFFYEISNGKIMAIREYFDPAGLMAQLGVGAAAAAEV
jgi:predicted ester cyclase